MPGLPRFPDPHPDSTAAVLESIGPDESVLDVGGWWKPLSRADHVVDLLPYATRGGGGRLGGGPERYSPRTWHQLDLCDTPWPFPDGAFDFAYCGQTLEDVRDPVAVCRELSRVARRGHIEVPSVWIECAFDVDVGPLAHRYPGYEKHRWLVFVEGRELVFVPKQVWLGLFEFVPWETTTRYRSDQRIWTSTLSWDGELVGRELSFAGQEQIVPILRRYFDDFDYATYQPD